MRAAQHLLTSPSLRSRALGQLVGLSTGAWKGACVTAYSSSSSRPHLCGQEYGGPRSKFPLPYLVISQSLVAVCQTVWAYQIIWGHYPLGWGRGWTPKMALLSFVGYHAIFGLPRANLWTCLGYQNIWDQSSLRLQWFGTWLTTPVHGPPCWICCSQSNSMSVSRSQPKKWAPGVLPSRKVIGSDRVWSGMYDFPLVVRSNHGPILYHFWDSSVSQDMLIFRIQPAFIASVVNITFTVLLECFGSEN